MRHCQIRPFPQKKWQQLHRADTSANYLEGSVLSPVRSNNPARDTVQSNQVANLVGILGSKNDVVPSFPKLVDNRQEKWDVWRVIQINPDCFLFCGRHTTTRVAFHSTRLALSRFRDAFDRIKRNVLSCHILIIQHVFHPECSSGTSQQSVGPECVEQHSM